MLQNKGDSKFQLVIHHETRRLRNFFCGYFLWLCFSLFFRFFFNKSSLVRFQAVNSDSFFFNGYASTPILLFLFSLNFFFF